jgi:hypothetical protein
MVDKRLFIKDKKLKAVIGRRSGRVESRDFFELLKRAVASKGTTSTRVKRGLRKSIKG